MQTIDSWIDKFMTDPIATFTGALFVATVVLALVGILQWIETRKTSKRQLRAYVFAETSYISNIVNPSQVNLLTIQDVDLPARITNPFAGPVANMQIKNSGQTPAFNVCHWGNIIFAPFPLPNNYLPTKPGNNKPMPCILGPGVMSSKLYFLPNPLTPNQVSDLVNGTGAIYVYGEITYEDAFGNKHFTNYRVMHHVMGGAIGVNTSLTFCEEGNDAD